MTENNRLERQEATPFQGGEDLFFAKRDVTDELRMARTLLAERAASEAFEQAKGNELTQDEVAVERIKDITEYLDTVQSHYLEQAA